MAEEAMSAFNHEIHAKLLVAYESQFFEALTEIFKTKDSEYAKAFYNSLYPRDDNVDYYIEQCKKLLASEGINDILSKLLKESIDMDTRRQKTYATFK